MTVLIFDWFACEGLAIRITVLSANREVTILLKEDHNIIDY